MKRRDTGSIEVSYGGCKALVKRRVDGRWAVRWREARRGRSTTLTTEEGAMTKAREIVRRLAGSQGGRMMTVEEAELVNRLKRICGDRHPVTFLSLLEDVVTRLGGLQALERAVRHYQESGLADVVRVTFLTARNRFLDLYDASPAPTRQTLRTELDAFKKAQPGVDVCDITQAMLESWLSRRKLDGKPVGARSWNNRHAVWVTFLNQCREWGYVAKGDKHVAERIEKQTEPELSVPIWTPALARRILGLLWEERPRRVPYFVVACWLGLRPSEVGRVCWEMFDWKRGYLHIKITVARKLMQERFVPLNTTARSLLERWLQAQGLWSKAERGELQGRIGVKRDHEDISALLRERGLIETWPHDVTRHSWISYMIALGHSKAEIAEWAGNSEAVIRKKYRRPLMREDGEDWFRLEPGH